MALKEDKQQGEERQGMLSEELAAVNEEKKSLENEVSSCWLFSSGSVRGGLRPMMMPWI